jgi:hypothetical protein
MRAGDVSDDTISLVVGALNRQFGQRIGSARAMSPNSVGLPSSQINREIDDFILTAKTGDPELDRALKAVRPHYKKLAGPMTQSFQRTSGAQ